jgi:hypothetical protein
MSTFDNFFHLNDHPLKQQYFSYQTKIHGFHSAYLLENPIFEQGHRGFVAANVLHILFFTFKSRYSERLLVVLVTYLKNDFNFRQ